MNDERCRELEKRLTEKEDEIRILRKKFGCVTGTDQTFIVEYDVPKRTFIYMNEATGKAINVFDDGGYLQHIIADDRSKGEAVLHHMHSQQDELLTIEYRWVFTNTTEYSWQFNEIFPSERDAEGKVIRYLAVCHRNNIWHRMDENLKNYRRRVSFISDVNRLSFIEFIVGQNFFYVLDTKGERADYTMDLKLWHTKVYPDDLPIAEKLLAHLQQRKSESFHTEYRYKATGCDQHKWYTIDIFPYKYDADNQITNYLILGKENDA